MQYSITLMSVLLHQRVEITLRRGFREISKVSLILCLFNMSVICMPLLLYIRRKIQGNVFAMVSFYHKNEIIHARQHVGRKFILFFSECEMSLFWGSELRAVVGILANIFLHTWYIQKFVNHSERAEIWQAFTIYFGRRDGRRRFRV